MYKFAVKHLDNVPATVSKVQQCLGEVIHRDTDMSGR